jgi:hypothetical protein
MNPVPIIPSCFFKICFPVKKKAQHLWNFTSVLSVFLHGIIFKQKFLLDCHVRLFFQRASYARLSNRRSLGWNHYLLTAEANPLLGMW